MGSGTHVTSPLWWNEACSPGRFLQDGAETSCRVTCIVTLSRGDDQQDHSTLLSSNSVSIKVTVQISLNLIHKLVKTK